MRLRQGTFSHLPDLSDEDIAAQVRYALGNGWPVSVEHTDDPHPRNVYWEMWGLPLFDLNEPDGVVAHINECRATFPDRYVRVQAYDPTQGRESTVLQFLVQRPAEEPGFTLDRGEGPGRTQRYAIRSYATARPAGARYTGG